MQYEDQRSDNGEVLLERGCLAVLYCYGSEPGVYDAYSTKMNLLIFYSELTQFFGAVNLDTGIKLPVVRPTLSDLQQMLCEMGTIMEVVSNHQIQINIVNHK